MSPTPDPLLVETVDRLLADVCTSEEIEHAEASGGWSGATWDALAEAGFPWVGIDETRGGSGGSLFDTAALLRAVGRFAAPVPLAETAMLGGWLLAEAGLELPAGPATVVDAADVRLVDGRLVVSQPVAWARHAHRIALIIPDGDGVRVASLRPEQVTVTPGANLAGEARDRVVIDVPSAEWETAAVSGGVSADRLSSTLRARGSLSRTIMAAGALASMAQMTVDYANERRQFGQPIARFQAVQQHLVTVTQCAVRAQMAADIALRALGSGDVGIDVATARVVVDDAITSGTRAAHQAHGAMGVTREYPLHQFSRRLWAWRHEWGTTRQWRRQLGSAVVASGADELFALIAR